MNFNQLRAVIKNIRSQIKCPTCDNSYATEDVSVVSAVANRCILVAQCTHCKLPILVTATLSNIHEHPASDSIVTEHKLLADVREEDFISTDDVLDMHQFLKSFSGDIRRAISSRPTDKQK